MKTLITGVSTRAFAESAVKSGHNVFSIDYFGDSDQKQIIENYSLLRDFNLPSRAENLIQVSNGFDFDSVVYISNFENFPELLEKLSGKVKILGNSPDTLRKVRDWKILREFMTVSNIPYPKTLLPGEESQACGRTGWLLKPTNSGGGSRIKAWKGERLAENQILQKHMDGIHASAGFLANGRKSVLIGLTAQLIGLNELGANGFTWCGNILPLPLERNNYLHLAGEIEKYASLLADNFTLRGAWGIDFIIAGNSREGFHPLILEINPRYTASMEIIEAAYGLNIFSLHLRALEGRLPDFSLARQKNNRFYGKGVIFARSKLKIGDTTAWKNRGIKDIPFCRDEIKKGYPICTVLANNDSYTECRSKLFSMAHELRIETGDFIKQGVYSYQ